MFRSYRLKNIDAGGLNEYKLGLVLHFPSSMPYSQLQQIQREASLMQSCFVSGGQQVATCVSAYGQHIA